MDCISVILWSPAAGVAAQDRQPQIGVLEKEGQGASRTLWTLWRLSSKLCSLLSRPDTGMGEAQNLNDLEREEEKKSLTTKAPLLPVPGRMALRVLFLKVLALLKTPC